MLGKNLRLSLKFKNIFLVLAFVCVSAPAITLAYAPYMPRLIAEGYPALIWPAEGEFALVPGISQSGTLKTDVDTVIFDPKGRQLFNDKQGKALLIFKGDSIRFEHYAAGYNSQTKFNSYSMVKSLVGALVLRAVADGRIKRLGDPVGVYLTELSRTEIGALSIDEIMRMRSGIVFKPDGAKSPTGSGRKDFKQTKYNPFGPVAQLHMLGLDAVAGKLRVDPQQRGKYNYQNLNTAILGHLISRVYSAPLATVLNDLIWVKAGAQPAHWRKYGEHLPVSAYCCLYATARDWLRIGNFLANNGSGKHPFLPRPLWRKFFGFDLSAQDVRRGSYGLHVYHDVLDRRGEMLHGRFTYMFGSKGQIVYMVPEENLVVVRFGEQIQLLHSTLYAAWRTISGTRAQHHRKLDAAELLDY